MNKLWAQVVGALANFRLAIIGVAVSILARAGSTIANLVVVPILLLHFGVEKYGVWVFIISLSTFLAFMDLGIGNSLLNRGARLKDAGKINELGTMVSTALIGFGLVGGGIACGIIAMHYLGYPIGWVFDIHDPESQTALMIYSCQVFITIPLAAIQRLQVGVGRGSLVPLSTLLTTCGSLGLIYFGSKSGMQLVPMVAWYSGLQLVVLISFTWYFLRVERILVQIAGFSLDLAVQLLKEGAPFFVLQMTATLVYYIDNVLVVRYGGLNGLASYSIGVRVFQLVGMIPMMANTFVWPMYTASAGRGDLSKIRKECFQVSSALLVWSLVAGGGVIFSLPLFLAIWLPNGHIQVPLALAIGLFVWTTIEAIGNSISTALNAMSRMRFQIALAPVTIILVLAAKIAVLESASISWLPLATTAGYVAGALVPQLIYFLKCTKTPNSAGLKNDE